MYYYIIVFYLYVIHSKFLCTKPSLIFLTICFIAPFIPNITTVNTTYLPEDKVRSTMVLFCSFLFQSFLCSSCESRYRRYVTPLSQSVVVSSDLVPHSRRLTARHTIYFKHITNAIITSHKKSSKKLSI